MSDYALPDEFLNREVCVVYGDSELNGSIVRCHMPFYIVLKTRYKEVLIPWTSITDITPNGKPENAPQSRQTQIEQQLKNDMPKPIPEVHAIEKQAEAVVSWDPSKIEWEPKDSATAKGPYERSLREDDNADFKGCQKWLQTLKEEGKHVGFSGGYTYWLFDDGSVGRRKVKKTRRY